MIYEQSALKNGATDLLVSYSNDADITVVEQLYSLEWEKVLQSNDQRLIDLVQCYIQTDLFDADPQSLLFSLERNGKRYPVLMITAAKKLLTMLRSEDGNTQRVPTWDLANLILNAYDEFECNQ